MLKIILIALLTMLSPKQSDFLINSTYDLNICSGSIRSGKTHINNVRFINDLETDCLPNVPCLISGRKVGGAYRNVIDPMLSIAKNDYGILNQFQFRHNPERLTYLPKKIVCYIEGANDSGSEERIRGMTIQRWVGDEVTTYPKNFAMQAVGRCSAGKRYKYLTCNPDAPMHWFKTDFIDPIENGKMNGKVWYFDIEKDNPVLEKAYIDQLKRLYTGVFYDRYILGKWVVAEGIIYDKYSRSEHVKDLEWWESRKGRIKSYYLGIDWGYSNPMAIVLFAEDGDGILYGVDEIYATETQVDDRLRDIMGDKGWLGLGIEYAMADKSRPEHVAAFETVTGIQCYSSTHNVKTDYIMEVQRRYVMGGNGEYGIYYIGEKVPELLKEKDNYRWKEKADKDEPVKENDHAQDAEQYLVWSRRGEQKEPGEIISSAPKKRYLT